MQSCVNGAIKRRMGEFRRIDDHISVAPQITVADVAAARGAGFVCIINNRPDGEEPNAPQSEQIAAACAEAGLAYHAIPVAPGGFAPDQVDAMANALARPGPVLAYCRSGTRSCLLWALAEARSGSDAKITITAKASAAGYDVSPVAPILDHLVAGR